MSTQMKRCIRWGQEGFWDRNFCPMELGGVTLLVHRCLFVVYPGALATLQLQFLWKIQPPALPLSVDGQGRANSLTTWLVLLPTSPHLRPSRSPQPLIISLAYKHTHITSEAPKGFRSYVPRVPGKGMGDKDQISISYYSHGYTRIFL